jgi:DNA modification methylase
VEDNLKELIKMTTVKDKYGVLPLSVMNFNNVPTKWKYEDSCLNIDLTRRGEGIKYLPELPYSKFSFGLAEFVTRYWSEPGDTILDQYMGWGIRGAVALKCDRHYIGYDISPEMFHRAEMYLDKLQDEDVDSFFGEEKTTHREIILGDGTIVAGIEPNTVDLAFTCPPYYNIEKYEDVPRQLSSANDYEEFLGMIDTGLKNASRVVKKDKFVILVVADFREGGFLRNFHGDTIEMGKQYMTHWDTIISDLNSPFAALQAAKCDRMKYTSKKHEYIIVFKVREE